MKKRFMDFGRYAGIFLILASTGVFLGCGSDDAPQPPLPAGKVVQGAVSGALVFADHKTGAEANFKMDPSEASTATTTAANGTFTLPLHPTYDYISVSSGGTDTLTGQPGTQMLAPAGVNIVSTATTAVVLEPAMAQKFTDLGINYTADISQSVTPAAALLIESIQTAISSMTKALDTGGNTLKNDQAGNLQRQAMTQIVAQVKNMTTAQMTTPATLTTNLQTAMKNTLDVVVANPTTYANIAFVGANTTTTLANAIVSPALITSVANAIDSTGTNTFSTAASSAVTESSLISAADVTNLNTATTTASTNGAADVTVTPPANTPPTITGTPTTTVTAGTAYSFKPTAVDTNGDSLTFSINKTTFTWATFNAATGELSGTPANANAGTITGIIISVSDGIATVSLPAFNLTVTSTTGTTGGTGGTL